MPAQAFAARFYLHSALDGQATEDKGENVYKDVVYIELRAMGDKNTSFSRPATDKDKTDFANAWAQYCDENVEIIEGTSIKQLPGVGPSMLRELKKYGIGSIEQLIEMTDSNAMNIQGALNLKHKAVAYLAALNAPVVKDVVKDEPEPPIDVEVAKRDPDMIPKFNLDEMDRSELREFLKANGQKPHGRTSDAKLRDMAREFI